MVNTLLMNLLPQCSIKTYDEFESRILIPLVMILLSIITVILFFMVIKLVYGQV